MFIPLLMERPATARHTAPGSQAGRGPLRVKKTCPSVNLSFDPAMGHDLTFEFFDFTDGIDPSAARAALPFEVVHVWRRPLLPDANAVAQAQKLLCSEERERALRYRVDFARNAFLLTRSALRLLLANYLDESPQQLRFRLTEYGKPLLDRVSDLHFNVSHTDGLALLAFVRKHRVGVDVEKIRTQPDALRLARRFFSDKERKELENLPADALPASFFRCWSRKEAYIKASGQGLSLPLSEFDVSVEEHPGQILLATRPDAGEARRWLVRDVPVGSEYAAAIAIGDVAE